MRAVSDWERDRRRGMSQFEREEEDAKSSQSVGCFFLVLAGALVLWNLYQVAQIANSASWSKTAGRVVASGTVPGPGSLASYITYAEVSYSYKVAERQYKSSTLRWGSDYRLTRAGATEEAARYPFGAEVDVYYDPDSPSDAVLEPGFNHHVVFDIVGSLLLMGLAFVVVNFIFERAAKVLMRHTSG